MAHPEWELPVLLIHPPKNSSSARQLKPRGTRKKKKRVLRRKTPFHEAHKTHETHSTGETPKNRVGVTSLSGEVMRARVPD